MYFNQPHLKRSDVNSTEFTKESFQTATSVTRQNFGSPENITVDASSKANVEATHLSKVNSIAMTEHDSEFCRWHSSHVRARNSIAPR
jgi:hypothetical protein